MIAIEIEALIGTHAPPTRQTGRTSVVTRMQKQSADRAGTGIEVFVIAPEGEIDPVGFEGVRHRADAVGEIPAHQNAPGAGGGGQGGHVQELPAHIEHARQDQHLHLIGQHRQNVLLAHGKPVARTHPTQVGGRVGAA